MAKKGRDDFSKPVKEEVGKRAGHSCSKPDCRTLTLGPSGQPNGTVSIGVAAHICAASPGGPRYDPNQSPQERVAASNGIWLCQNDARLVDVDDPAYSVELLRQWKAQHEEWVRNTLGKMPVSSATPPAERPKPTLWPHRGGAPQFELSPILEPTGELNCSFKIRDATPLPNTFEARWEGPGIDANVLVTRENTSEQSVQQKWQLKSGRGLRAEAGEQVVLHISFSWDGERHGGSWTWRVVPHDVKQHIYRLDTAYKTGQPGLDSVWSKPPG